MTEFGTGPICGEPHPGGLFCRFVPGHGTGHSWDVIPQLPADKKTQALYVQAAQDLQWLADNGALNRAATSLASLRHTVDHEQRAHEAHLERVQLRVEEAERRRERHAKG